MNIVKGDAYVLRTCAADMTNYNGFLWPRSGPVEAPDWEPTEECGNGLHGFLWGEGHGNLADFEADANWLVCRVTEWIDLGGKVKFPRADVVFCGSRIDATSEIIRLGAVGPVIGASVTVGNGGTARVGYKGTATAGNRGTATAGTFGTATVGGGGVAQAGYKGTAIAGDYGTAKVGYGGTATAGIGGSIQIIYFDRRRHHIKTGDIDEDGLKPNTPYRLTKDFEFKEA